MSHGRNLDADTAETLPCKEVNDHGCLSEHRTFGIQNAANAIQPELNCGETLNCWDEKEFTWTTQYVNAQQYARDSASSTCNKTALWLGPAISPTFPMSKNKLEIRSTCNKYHGKSHLKKQCSLWLAGCALGSPDRFVSINSNQ